MGNCFLFFCFLFFLVLASSGGLDKMAKHRQNFHLTVRPSVCPMHRKIHQNCSGKHIFSRYVCILLPNRHTDSNNFLEAPAAEAGSATRLSRYYSRKWSFRGREMATFLESFSKTLRSETGCDHRGDRYISETVVSCTRNIYFCKS